jgi:CheY-like chemotaxis protein
MCVLVVEDEAPLRELIEQELSDAGMIVLSASNGEDGLAILESEQPIDVLLTDIRLPGAIDGWLLAERARQRRPDLAVIYVTGYAEDRRAQLPNTVYISKPYRAALIVDQITRWGEAKAQKSRG